MPDHHDFESAIDAFPVKLDNFEGPIDLLLHLIKKSEVDVHDIPIALITQQYLDAIQLLQELNLAERCTVISFVHDFLLYAIERGWAHVGPVLNAWQEIHSAAIAALQPDVVFCAIEQLPAQYDLSAIVHPLAVYEVDRFDIANDLLQRGVRWVETFTVGELLAANL